MNTRKIPEIRKDEVIDLGKASTAIKGEAKIEQDVGGGRLRFLTGIAQD